MKENLLTVTYTALSMVYVMLFGIMIAAIMDLSERVHVLEQTCG